MDTIIDRDQIDAARRLPDPLNFIISINNLQNQSAATSTTVPYTDRSYEQRLNPGYYNVTVWNRNVVNPNGTSSAEYMINGDCIIIHCKNVMCGFHASWTIVANIKKTSRKKTHICHNSHALCVKTTCTSFLPACSVCMQQYKYVYMYICIIIMIGCIIVSIIILNTCMHSVPTSLFADEIATDSNGYPCIRVAINNSCLQCASSFSGQLAYKNGSCGTNEAFKFSNRTMQFDSNMQACVPFEDILETEVCYYVLVHSIKDNYAQAVAQSIEKPVLLFPCNATKIPLEFNTSVEGFIRHNQLIDLACIDNELMVLNGPNEIRCVNGTFLPSVDNIFCAVENPQCPIMDSYGMLI